ncbi:unnamed protein product [Penicillium bialowiezense]
MNLGQQSKQIILVAIVSSSMTATSALAPGTPVVDVLVSVDEPMNPEEIKQVLTCDYLSPDGKVL